VARGGLRQGDRGKGETWKGINDALDQGRRSLPGGSSLARLLAELTSAA
jgi:hypothetical protein